MRHCMHRWMGLALAAALGTFAVPAWGARTLCTGSLVAPVDLREDPVRELAATATETLTYTTNYLSGGESEWTKLYVVIDLTSGAVEEMDAAPADLLSNEAYKTTKLVMRRIEPGTFTMGDDGATERPKHTVTLTKPYYMGVFAVTAGQYQQVMGSNPSQGTGKSDPKAPVDTVPLYGLGFSSNVVAKTGRSGFDLPTEAQWEYACRAGTTTAYYYGDTANDGYMWHNGISGFVSHEVGTAPEEVTAGGNPWGLYDMHGNSWEYCRDWFDSSYYEEGQVDPTGPFSELGDRVTRGGSWAHGVDMATSAFRCYESYPGADDPMYQGFRLVRTLTKTLPKPTSGVSVDITVNGEARWSGLSGAGTVQWTPDAPGTNILRHVVRNALGNVIANYRARYVVPFSKIVPNPDIPHLTARVYTNGVEVAGPDFIVYRDTPDTTIVYEPEPYYVFPDGSVTPVTNRLDTSVNPAVVRSGEKEPATPQPGLPGGVPTAAWRLSGDASDPGRIDQRTGQVRDAAPVETLTYSTDYGAEESRAEHEGVQLWENGPYFATTNVGAEKPQDYGYYFWWGDTVGYRRNATDDGWVSSQDGTTPITFSATDATASATYQKSGLQLQNEGWTDATTGNLVVSDDAAKNRDAARAHWGAPWRMPTYEEIAALVDHGGTRCTWTWSDDWNGTGISGYVVAGATEGFKDRSIFLPAAGMGNASNHIPGTGEYAIPEPCETTVWGSNLTAESLYFNQYVRYNEDESYRRFKGFTVRPVSADAPGGGKRVEITVNGETLAKDLEGSGTVAWTPSVPGTNELHHIVTAADGTAVTNILARFYVSVVEVVPPDVAHATAKVYTNGVEVAGPPFEVISNATAVVVYEADPGYVFPGGATTVERAADTSRNPAGIIGDVPEAPASGIAGVTARQRYPWNGLVDIDYELAVDSLSSGYELKVMAVDTATHATNVAATVRADTKPLAKGAHTLTWDMNADGLDYVSTNVVFLVGAEKLTEAVQLWENGPYFATENVGAEKPQDYGYYFWWGDTVGYKRNAQNDGWVSSQDETKAITFSNTDATAKQTCKNIATLKSGGWIDDSGNLVVSDDAAKNHDAARAHRGAPWRMMTEGELLALIANTTTTWTYNWNGTGVAGRIVTGKGDYDKNSIFLPAAGIGEGSDLSNARTYGYYWSSTPCSDTSYAAWALGSGSSFGSGFEFRYNGVSVRPVRSSAPGGGSVWGASERTKVDLRVDVVRDAAPVETLTYSTDYSTEGGVQLWENGPYFATKNVGAEKTEDYGYYFWWGDTVGYKRNAAGYRWVSSKDGTTEILFSSTDAAAGKTYEKDNATLKTMGYIDDAANPCLNAEHDAATQHWGSPWRMMTDAELQALIDNTTTEWTDNWNGTGVAGRIVTGKGDYAQNSIFLPAAGYGESSSLIDARSEGNFRSSTPDSDSSSVAYCLCFDSGEIYRGAKFRYTGRSVRPVRASAPGGGKRVEITVNGETLAKDLEGSGTVAWTPSVPGTNELHHIVTAADGTAVTNLLARFYVPPTVKVVPTDLTHATAKVYTNGVEVVKTGEPPAYNVYSNQTDTIIVYTAEDGYQFPGGATAYTNHMDTAKNPAGLAGGEQPPSEPTKKPVSYLEPVYVGGVVTSGIDHWETNSVSQYTEVTSDQTTWNAGCYVVKGNVEMSSCVTVSGDVKLILTDGCLMTVRGVGTAAGICVSGTGNALTIYGQSAGTGTLRATGDSSIPNQSGAGIGGGYGSEGSNITINGGTVEANGGFRCAGIGGGRGRGGSNITINGGTVTAKGNGEAAGIGGGLNGTGSDITINGGTVTATGGSAGGCAGIGGGSQGAGSNITINGGTVTAGDSSSQNGAGIGGGYRGAGSNITISGGTVTATGGKFGAGIGGGRAGEGSNITISGGMVTATGGLFGAGIGGGQGGAGSNITINGGTVTAKGNGEAAGIGGGVGGKGSDIEIGQNAAVYVHGDAELIGSGTAGDEGSGNSIAPGAKVFFNLAGTAMPASFEGLAIMTPETPVERVLVNGIANWTAAETFNLTNAVSGATGTIAVNGAAGTVFSKKLLKLPHDTTAQTLKLTVEDPPPTVEVRPNPAANTSVGGVYTNGVAVAKTGEKYMVASGAAVDVVFQGNAGYFFQTGGTYTAVVTNSVTAESDPTVVAGPAPKPGTKCGEAVYGFLDDGVMTLLGTGATGSGSASNPFTKDKDSITNVVIEAGVTEIGPYFFKLCTRLNSVTGGKDLAKVGKNTFFGCFSLETISLDCTAVPSGLEEGGAGFIPQQALTPQGEVYWIPAISVKGHTLMLYGKETLDDDWEKIGPAKGAIIYNQGVYRFFQTKLEKDGK